MVDDLSNQIEEIDVVNIEREHPPFEDSNTSTELHITRHKHNEKKFKPHITVPVHTCSRRRDPLQILGNIFPYLDMSVLSDALTYHGSFYKTVDVLASHKLDTRTKFPYNSDTRTKYSTPMRVGNSSNALYKDALYKDEIMYSIHSPVLHEESQCRSGTCTNCTCQHFVNKCDKPPVYVPKERKHYLERCPQKDYFTYLNSLKELQRKELTR